METWQIVLLLILPLIFGIVMWKAQEESHRRREKLENILSKITSETTDKELQYFMKSLQ